MMALSVGVIEFYLLNPDGYSILTELSHRLDPPPSAAAGGTRKRPRMPRSFSPPSPLFSIAVSDLSRNQAALSRDQEIEAILDHAASMRRWSTIVNMGASLDTGVAAGPQVLTPTDGNALYQLTVDLQRELKRVGCYHGLINGVWSTNSRQAMAQFIASVNAMLSFDRPDYALLTLVRAHLAKVCDTECKPHEVVERDGHCVPSTVLARSRPDGVEGKKPAHVAAGAITQENGPVETAIGRFDPAFATAIPGPEEMSAGPRPESPTSLAPEKRVDQRPPLKRRLGSSNHRQRDRGAGANRRLPPTQLYTEPPGDFGHLR